MENKRNQGYGEENSPNQRLQTNRELALEWWSKLSEQEKVKFHNKSWTPTGKEVEEIWKNEVQVVELRNAEHNAEYLEKPNQKQFTQFSEELFLKYINKFSNEDLYKAHNILTKLRLERK